MNVAEHQLSETRGSIVFANHASLKPAVELVLRKHDVSIWYSHVSGRPVEQLSYSIRRS